MIAFRNCGAVSPIDQRKKGELDLVELYKIRRSFVRQILKIWRRADGQRNTISHVDIVEKGEVVNEVICPARGISIHG